jgi:alpha,alpha-trehalase
VIAHHATQRAPAITGPAQFPPIADYGFLSDCEATCLVAPSGNIEWMCLPRMDGPSVFGAILDRDAGGFRLGPADVMVPAGRRYLPGTNVLETTWMTRMGWIVVRDGLTVGPWHDEQERSGTHRRAPTDNDAEHVLVRTVVCVQGTVELTLECDPAFDYARKGATWEYTGPAYNEAVATADGIDTKLKLTTDMRVGFEGRRARARTTLREGETAFAALSWSTHAPPSSYEEAQRRLERTADFWREWLNHGHFPDHPWRIFLQRSALTLKGLSYAPTGAMCAASTTSLPETPKGERNWDYRYTWIRDSTFMLWGLYTLGFDWEANDFFYFIADAAGSDEDVQIMYGIGGEKDLTERTLDHLSGYDGARPVRIGNGAWDQKQHDVWGAVLDSLYLHTKSRDEMPERFWPLIERLVNGAIENWDKPDRGIWEIRGEPRHFTSSKLFCWVALDRGARLARLRDAHHRADEWQAIADVIHKDICANALRDDDVFAQYYGGQSLDASCLLMPLTRFLPPTDHRIRKTVLAIGEELSEQGLILRYRVEDTDDGLSGEEGTFAICSFWMVSALEEINEHRRARELCEKMLSYSSELYLYAEEIDAHTGRHLGNFPQAFTHLALINAVMHVIRSDQAQDPRQFSRVD